MLGVEERGHKRHQTTILHECKTYVKIMCQKTQQEAYTRQMMLFQRMSTVYIYTSDKVRLIIIKYILMDGRH